LSDQDDANFKSANGTAETKSRLFTSDTRWTSGGDGMVPGWPEIEKTQPSSHRLQRKPLAQNVVEATLRGQMLRREG
jgi:hypothetical protein